MGLAVVEAREIIVASKRMLGLPTSPDGADRIDDTHLAALLRRSAGFLCPCSAATLRSTAIESLKFLIEDPGDIAKNIAEAIAGLTVCGDILELTQAATADVVVPLTSLFAGPPRFVVRSNGNIFLMGIVADHGTYLPRSLAERIQHEGSLRILTPAFRENLVQTLSELGFQQVSQEDWLTSPANETADEIRTRLLAKLSSTARSGSIAGLRILDSKRPVTRYSCRWVDLSTQSGVFVARRAQEFGPAIWCLVDARKGEPRRLLDLPLPGYRWRGCDAAWHLQMAVDYLRGAPQLFRLRRDGDCVHLGFFSPLPIWAQRRLIVLGHESEPRGCLLSYRIPISEVQQEIQFLREHLWLEALSVDGKE